MRVVYQAAVFDTRASESAMPEIAGEDAVLAKLASATDSVDALSVAIDQASFLDQKPGEGRQKLRGKAFANHPIQGSATDSHSLV